MIFDKDELHSGGVNDIEEIIRISPIQLPEDYIGGKNGFGLYRCEAGGLSFEYAEKISDTLTDFLVNGKGIDIATTL